MFNKFVKVILGVFTGVLPAKTVTKGVKAVLIYHIYATRIN